MRLLLLLSAILTALTGVVSGSRAMAEPVQASASAVPLAGSARTAVMARPTMAIAAPASSLPPLVAAPDSPLLPAPSLYTDRRRE